MNTIFKSAIGFVVGYLVFMLPTYLLPYFGSNSAIVGAIGAALGRGFTPQFWLHAWCMGMLVLATAIRGKNIGKGWLLIFPLLASVFDLVPGLNIIPLVPTVMHLAALILGARGAVTVHAGAVVGGAENASASADKALQWEPWAAGLITVAAIGGIVSFMTGANQTFKPFAVPAKIPTNTPVQPPAGLGAINAENTSQPLKVETSVAAQSATTVISITPANQTSQAPEQKSTAKRVSRGTAVSREPKSKQVENQPTVRYININN